MLEKFYSKRLDMYPLEEDVYWRVMRQHKLSLVNVSQEITLDSGLYIPSKYSYYRYFLNIELEARLWVPTMVASGINNIEDFVLPNQVILVPDITSVESIISSVA